MRRKAGNFGERNDLGMMIRRPRFAATLSLVILLAGAYACSSSSPTSSSGYA